MAHAVTPKILHHIAKLISSGRPIWGLLWANEYLAHQPEIRLAYIHKASAMLRSSSAHGMGPELFQMLIQGQTFSELPTELQERVRSEREVPQIRNRTVISQKPWRALRESNLRRRAVGL